MKKLKILIFIMATPLLPATSFIQSNSRPEGKKFYVRLTAYSPKEPGESSIGSRNNCIKNENGVAISRDMGIPFSSLVRLPDGKVKRVDDTTNKRLHRRVDVRYYQSVSRKGIKRQLQSKDMGRNYIEIIRWGK